MAKILLVEDDLMLADIYNELLKDAGYIVDYAKDGVEALSFASKGGYDLILLDIMLPKMSGFEVLKALSAKPPVTPNKKIILMTNLGQDQTTEQAKNYGVTKSIVKSNVNPEQFLAEVQANLQ